MPKIEYLFTDSDLVLECAKLLGLKTNLSIEFDPINNVSDWGLIINAMLDTGFDFTLDHDGIMVNGPLGMVTFNDDNIGRRLVKSFILLSEHISKQSEVKCGIG